MDSQVNSGRFQPGQSGNPLGPFAVVAPRVNALMQRMLPDYDSLTGTELIQLEQACRLLDRSQHTQKADVAIRASNAALRMLAALQPKKKKKRNAPPSNAPVSGLERYLDPKREAAE
jgi:hypothetical protein